MKSISILVFVLVFCEGRYLGLVDDVVPKFMLHTTIHDDIVLEAGESIQLTCSSKMPGSVSWSYPRQKQPNEVEEPTVTILEEVVNENGADQYISKLIVANITTNDTGLYECSCMGVATQNVPHIIQAHAAASDVISSYDVYVFVSDPTELFQEEHAGIRQPLTGFSRSYVEFPCAVNNPNTTVELLDDSGHGNFIPVPVDGKKCTYDPKTGFTLSKVHIRDSGAYTCKATYGEHEERKEFYLHVLRGNPLLTMPVLKTESHSVSEGVTNTFKCQVMVGTWQLLAITWWKQVDGEQPIRITSDSRVHVEDVVSAEALCSGSRVMCSFLRHSSVPSTQYSLYSKWVGKLKIVKTKQSDSAQYYCTASSEGKYRQSNVIDFTVTSD